jgi:hypothetical protein
LIDALFENGRPARMRMRGAAIQSFILFVDALFTTLWKSLFTKAFGVIALRARCDCVCSARTSD